LEVLVDALIARGFRVLTFDMPAHGHSAAQDTDILQVTDIIMTLADSKGPLVAAIGHSFGGVCLANAVRQKLDVARLVLFSTPSSFTGMIDKYCQVLGIRQPTKARLAGAIARRLAPFTLHRELNPRYILGSSNLPTLVIHDQDDGIVPFSEAEELSRARADIDLFATSGLGHSGTVRDGNAIDRCISFICDDQRVRARQSGSTHAVTHRARAD
jgi:pimeloyl-ACP methyl ester carboxylesterase